MKFFSQYYYQIDRSKWIFIISFVFITRCPCNTVIQHRLHTYATSRDWLPRVRRVATVTHRRFWNKSTFFSSRQLGFFAISNLSSPPLRLISLSEIFENIRNETSKYFCPARVLFKDDPFKLNSGKKKKKKAMRLDDAPHTRNLHVHPRFMRATTRDNETINMQRTGPGQWRSCTISLWQRTYPRTSGIRIRNNVNDRCQRTGRSIPLSFLSSQFHPFSFSSTII